jgi:hypothetical protein
MSWFTCKKSAEELEVIEYVLQKKREDKIVYIDERIKAIVASVNLTIKYENRAAHKSEIPYNFFLTCLIPWNGASADLTYTSDTQYRSPGIARLIHPDIILCRSRLIAGYVLHRCREELLYIVSGK